MPEPKPTDPVTHMQMREYLEKYVPRDELPNNPAFARALQSMEGVENFDERVAEAREMMASFMARYEAREERFRDFTLTAWAEAIRHEMHAADTKLRQEMHAADTKLHETVADLKQDIARQFGAFEELMRDYMGALLEPHDGVPERVTKLEELPPRVEHLEARVFAPKRQRAPAKRRKTTSQAQAKSRRR